MIGSEIFGNDLIVACHIGSKQVKPIISYWSNNYNYKNQLDKKDHFIGLCVNINQKMYIYFRRSNDNKIFFSMIFEKVSNENYQLVEYFNIAADELQDPSWKLLALQENLTGLIKQFDFFLSRNNIHGRIVDKFIFDYVFSNFSDLINFSSLKITE